MMAAAGLAQVRLAALDCLVKRKWESPAMPQYARLNAFATALSFVLLAGSVNAQVVITQQKAVNGSITPGDRPGFPITISQPGSYILEDNLHPPQGKDGIVIASHDVTIDFNGYRLHGYGTANRGIFGDTWDTALIKNGVIAGFTGIAITGRTFWTVQDMRVLVNGGDGIQLVSSGRIQRNTISYNGGNGVTCLNSCLIESSVIDHNNDDGVLSFSGTALGNSIFNNRYYGLTSSGGGAMVGYGNNTLFGNNSGGAQVGGSNIRPLQPNACVPAC